MGNFTFLAADENQAQRIVTEALINLIRQPRCLVTDIRHSSNSYGDYIFVTLVVNAWTDRAEGITFYGAGETFNGHPVYNEWAFYSDTTQNADNPLNKQEIIDAIQDRDLRAQLTHTVSVARRRLDYLTSQRDIIDIREASAQREAEDAKIGFLEQSPEEIKECFVNLAKAAYREKEARTHAAKMAAFHLVIEELRNEYGEDTLMRPIQEAGNYHTLLNAVILALRDFDIEEVQGEDPNTDLQSKGL